MNPDEPPPVTISYLINQGIPINAQDVYGMTPLHYAMRSKNADAAIALLEAGLTLIFLIETMSYPWQ